jgi:hypothetical protein
MLKNKYTKLVAAMGITLFAASAQAAIVELTTNGGFETGDFTGWTQFPNGGFQGISSVNPSSGSFSANLSADFPTNSLIKNANIGIGIVNPGDEITISFDMRGVTQIGGIVFAEFFSELDGGGVSAAEILGGGPLFGSTDWVTYDFTTFAGANVDGGVTLQLGAVCGGDIGCLSDVYFDNVSVTVDAAPAVPVPAAVWLFGSGLLGLIGVARRKTAA